MNIPIIEHDLKSNADWQLVVERAGSGFTAMFRDTSLDTWSDEYGHGSTITEAIAALEIAIQREGT
jgi:hypothetical protein